MEKKNLYAIFLGVFILIIIGCSSQTQNDTVPVGNNQIPAPENSNTVVTQTVIAKLSDVPSGTMKEFSYSGESAMLVNFDGDIKAYVNKCPHKNLAFNDKSLVGDKIQCPWHGNTFSPTTGEYLGNVDGNNYGVAGLTMVNVKVVGENIILA